MTLFASLAGVQVIRARVSIPYTGLWHADVWLEGVATVSGQQTLTIGPWAGKCSVARQIDFAGQTMVRLVAGAGGWSRVPASPLFWADASLSTVLGDVASSVGEQVHVQADRAVSPFYVLDGQTPASTALQDLAGAGWWVDLAGVTQVGTRPSPVIASPFTIRDVDGPPGVYHVETESIADWVPGATFSGPTASGTVSRVTHFLEAGRLSTEVMVPRTASATTDRLRDAIRAILGQMMPGWIYLATWAYTVESTSGGPSGVTVDAAPPDGMGLPSVTGLPLRADASGSVAAPAVGSKVLVGFVAGDRYSPEIRGLDGSTAPTSVWLGQGTMPLARLGDQVQCFLPPGMPFTGVDTAGPVTGTIISASPISGVIVQGSPVVMGA